MSSQPLEHQHPVVEFVDRLACRLDSLADVPVMSMSAQDKREALVGLAKSRAQLETLSLRLLAEAEHSEVTTESGAATAADWLAIETRQVRRDARSDLKLATRLEQHGLVATGMAAGLVNVAQARAIVASLERLPRTGEFAISSQQRREAEAHLVELAAHHDAKDLRDPGPSDPRGHRPRPRREVRGTCPRSRGGQGRPADHLRDVGGRRRHHPRPLPDPHPPWPDAAQDDPGPHLAEPPTTPSNHATHCGIDPDLPAPVRDGMAFTELIESVTAKELPRTGGCGATVVVTMTLDQLLADLAEPGVCTLDTGGQISASEARRLACRAGIIPMVLGGKSQVLDVGHKCRFHNEPMRIAMGVRDGGCTTEGCDVPPGLCHAHHDIPYSEGGSTSVKDGRLLCPHHHRRIHDARYEATHLPNGKIRFHRRE